MRFSNWTLDDLIGYLTRMKSAPSDRLDCHCVTRVHGEIFVENGERKDGKSLLFTDLEGIIDATD